MINNFKRKQQTTNKRTEAPKTSWYGASFDECVGRLQRRLGLRRIWTTRGSNGWRSGENTLPPLMWPGFKSRRRRYMWVMFVIGSLFCSERFFSGFQFSPLLENQQFQISIWSGMVDDEPLFLLLLNRYCKPGDYTGILGRLDEKACLPDT